MCLSSRLCTSLCCVKALLSFHFTVFALLYVAQTLFALANGRPSRHSGQHCMHDIFSGPHLRFMRTEQKKVITSADVLFSSKNLVKSKKICKHFFFCKHQCSSNKNAFGLVRGKFEYFCRCRRVALHEPHEHACYI